MKMRIDVETLSTSHTGIKGIFELVLRRFKTLVHLSLLLPIYALASVVLGICLVPGISFFMFVLNYTHDLNNLLKYFLLGSSFAASYFMYGFTLLFVAPLVNRILVGRLKEWRGPYYSFESLRWYIHNGLTYLVRYSFLEFATPTPFALVFYQMMGMKIGRGVTINTTHISDPSLIEIGDKTTLGGSVAILAHYGQGGLLIIAPVKIGASCTIGLKASIMGGTVIGDGAKILPHSVVLPKTIIPAGETWGGVPAHKIESLRLELKRAA